MSWRVAAVVGTCAGGVVWVVRRRTRRAVGAGEWAAATDPVAASADPVVPATS